MARFIKSKFKVLWGTVFSFFYGIFATDIVAQEDEAAEEAAKKQAAEKAAGSALAPGAIAAAVAVSYTHLTLPTILLV